MSEYIKRCLHCDAAMQVSRSTKKYCSDACKQAAFYNRTVQPSSINGTADEDEYADDLSDTDERYPMDDAQTVKQLPFNVTVNVTKGNSKASAMQPQTYPIHPKRVTPVSFADEEPENEEPEEEELPFTVTPKPAVTVNDKRGGTVNSKPGHKTPMRHEPEEEPYEWVRCELIDAVADYTGDNYKTAEMFQYPQKYWYGSELEKVKWVSLRFRCILENLLRLDKNWVERKAFVMLGKAMRAITESSNYKYLPYGYPLTNDIKELQKMIMLIPDKVDKQFRFSLRPESKVKVMALRFQLADLVPFVKFRDLDFYK